MININGYYMVIIWLVMANNYIWLVVDLPLWKKNSQMGWWNSQYMEKYNMFQTTHQITIG